MSAKQYVNGNRPTGLQHLLDPSLKLASRPKNEDVNFDLDKTLNSIVSLTSNISSETFSAKTLGTEREGNAILINDDGLLITIGYLVLDAHSIYVRSKHSQQIPAELVLYNHETGIAIVRAETDLAIDPISIGSSRSILEGNKVIVASYGGSNYSINATVASRQEFTGSWEYMLDDAIFTLPTHPNWSGAGLIDIAGNLCGIGSLWINENEKYLANVQEKKIHAGPGNMFVPIDIITPLYQELISTGNSLNTMRPWLGIYTTEVSGQLVVSGIIPDGPADNGSVKQGDLILAINGQEVNTLSKMYKLLWSIGPAGSKITIRVDRGEKNIDLIVTSDSRYNFIKVNKKH